MPTLPRLVPVAPTPGPEVPIQETPFWIGAAQDSALPVFLPGVSARHVAIVEREDGFWVTPVRAAVPRPELNGVGLLDPVRLRQGDILRVAPGAAYRFESGQATARPRRAEAAPLPPPPLPPPPRRRKRPGWTWRPRLRWTHVGMTIAILLLLGAAGAFIYALTRPDTIQPLSEADAREYDRLIALSYDHVERGATLLELNIPGEALKEFARATRVLETSRLRDNAWGRPQIATLERTIAAVYREKRVAVPAGYRDVPRAPSRSTPAAPPARPGSQLSAADFAQRFESVQQRFEARFGRRIVVTGRDHAEHLSLYGHGGALDLRVRDLSREQIEFAIQALRAEGIRVKDFSTDQVLQAQVASARRAGLHDRASTGLHLHIDRFVSRRDRWTVQ
ncbi:MAG TPA: FHA domain-containing protein [Longimicrobium sp.]|nr:FHA domain-containing protein [Longimicrobium sp.]